MDSRDESEKKLAKAREASEAAFNKVNEKMDEMVANSETLLKAVQERNQRRADELEELIRRRKDSRLESWEPDPSLPIQ